MIFNQSGGGDNTQDATVTSSSQILSPYTAYSKGIKYTGSIPTQTSSSISVVNNVVTVPSGYYSSSVSKTVGTAKSAQTYTPTTSNQTISSGLYLTGTQTILGDSNLVAGNIKQGVSIFGVTGTTYPQLLGSYVTSTSLSSTSTIVFDLSSYPSVNYIGICGIDDADSNYIYLTEPATLEIGSTISTIPVDLFNYEDTKWIANSSHITATRNSTSVTITSNAEFTPNVYYKLRFIYPYMTT